MIRHDNALHLANATQSNLTFSVLSRFNGVVGLQHALRFRNRSEVFADEAERSGFIEFASKEKDRVIGLVVVPVEGLETLDGDVLDVAAGADRGLSVIVPEKRRRHDALLEHVHR